MGVIIPATGTGDATPLVATDKVAGANYQQVKIVDGTIGGSQGAVVDSLGNLRIAMAAATALVGASVSNFPAVQPVSGSVSFVNQLNPQPVSGSVAVTNLPANQQVTIASSTGQIGASVSNFPAVQPVSGSVSVVNFPATQQVMGLVGASIANTPTVTLASSTIQVGVSVANYPANIGSTSAFIASAYPGVYVGASIAGGTLGASTVNVGGSVTSYPAAAATGGASPYHYVSGASVNQVNVKNAAGTIYTLAAMNQNVNQRYLKLFDKGSTPSPGTDLPVQTYMIPGASAGAGAVIPLPVGLLFANGIGFAITGQISDTDATTVGASDVVVNIAFK